MCQHAGAERADPQVGQLQPHACMSPTSVMALFVQKEGDWALTRGHRGYKPVVVVHYSTRIGTGPPRSICSICQDNPSATPCATPGPWWCTPCACAWRTSCHWAVPGSWLPETRGCRIGWPPHSPDTLVRGRGVGSYLLGVTVLQESRRCAFIFSHSSLVGFAVVLRTHDHTRHRVRICLPAQGSSCA